NAPETGKVFDKWITTDGVTFANENNATTSFTMPAKAVTVTAIYKDAPPETPDYKIIDGENGTWNKGKTTGLVITSKGDYDDFTGLNVDDILIDTSNYTVAAGSTVVTLKSAYLETLTVGTHVIALKFGNYSVQTNLTILVANEEPDESNLVEIKSDNRIPQSGEIDLVEINPDNRIPQTGEINHISLFIGLMLLSGPAIIVITYNKKKKRSYNK
ncbi:MAG: LPXTG cell wall anchor domain-containing protein, partial [Clostridia bacterium]|nr:LPXTG cell wall anchor domain-containing protein [Clostridia bacterium]